MVTGALGLLAPTGVILQGVVIGAATGLLAVGLVLTYRATRAINFAYGAMGGLPATVGVGLYLAHGWPWPAAVAVAVLGGALVGVLTERVARRFTRSSRLVLTVATIGMAQILGGIELFVPGWLGSPRLVGGFPTALNDVKVAVHPVVLTGNDLLILALVPAVLAALGWFLLRTDPGAAIRALAENEERARLLGLPVARLSALVWGLSGALAALVVILRAPADGLTIDAAAGATLLLPALAAAVVANLESLPVAFGAGVGLGVVDQVVRWNVDRQATTSVVFLVVILGGLALRTFGRQGRKRVTRLDPDASSWSGAGRLRAMPAALRDLPEVRAARLGLVGAVVAAALLVPVLSSPSQLNQVSVALVYGLVALSLVVLAGWGGAVSLGQVAIVGVGALVAGNLVARSNVDLFLALAAGGLAGGVTALAIGLPALRIRGLFLAVTTMAFAVAMDSFFLNPANFRELIPGSFERPVLWKRFDLRSERPLYFVCLGLLVLAVGFVAALRRSRAGRSLIATRDNQRGAEAAGVPAVRARLEAFVVAGVIAGVAGGLHAVLLRGIGFHTYEPSLSLLAFSMAVIGGLTSVPGALSGVALVQAAGWMFPRLQLLITGTGLLVVLLATPGGLAEAGQRLRDRLLVLVARRHGLDVTPSADGTVVGDEPARRAVADPATLLDCRGVDAGYGHLQVLFGCDLTVAEGEMVALLGTNGAGKSTLLRAVSGLLPLSDGAVTFGGSSIGGVPAERLASSGLALVPGGRGVFPGLTVADNLRLACWTIRHDEIDTPGVATERVLDLFPRLRERLSTKAGEMSGGEQQMLSLGMALATRPRLLCIDELSLGLAPAVVEHLIGVVRDVHASGVTVIVVEQSAAIALRLADRAVFLEKGRVRFTGPTADLLERPDLLRAVFLGAGADAATGRVPGPSPASDGAGPALDVPALQTHSLTRRFGGVTAVDGVTLTVAPGEIVGILGANGAGKTTMFDLISGFLTPDSGAVVLAGTDVTGAPPSRRALSGLGRSFQEARLFPSLTVAETLAVALERHFPNHDPLAAGMALPAATDPEAAAAARVEVLLVRFGLAGYRDTLTGDLSTGTRRVVELACVVAQQPVLALLDEPSAGLAQRETEAMGPLLRQVRDEAGCAMVVIEHDVALLAGLCDRLVALEAGAVIADGPPGDVLADPGVVAAYLGSATTSVPA